jgi:hypothetical protein
MTLVWKSGYSFDSDASTYIDAVETADGQALETGVRVAINDFVLGCKQDGIWNAIKASCILAGARTLDGALVPLVGGGPTNNNFVSADYDRKTGLNKDANGKYLASGRFTIEDPQNDCHASVFGDPGSNYGGLIGAGSNSAVVRSIQTVSSTLVSLKCNNATYQGVANSFGLIGVSRSSASSFLARAGGTNTTFNEASASVSNLEIDVFKRGSVNTTRTRLSFYSVGESLDLAKLDTRVSNLITAIGAAIP